MHSQQRIAGSEQQAGTSTIKKISNSLYCFRYKSFMLEGAQGNVGNPTLCQFICHLITNVLWYFVNIGGPIISLKPSSSSARPSGGGGPGSASTTSAALPLTIVQLPLTILLGLALLLRGLTTTTSCGCDCTFCMTLLILPDAIRSLPTLSSS